MTGTMAKKKPGRPKSSDLIAKVPLHVEVLPEMKEAIEALAEQNHRKITGEVVVALKDHLQRNGFWPWPPPPAEDAE